MRNCWMAGMRSNNSCPLLCPATFVQLENSARMFDVAFVWVISVLSFVLEQHTHEVLGSMTPYVPLVVSRPRIKVHIQPFLPILFDTPF
jgi:hypothetical protein